MSSPTHTHYPAALSYRAVGFRSVETGAISARSWEVIAKRAWSLGRG